MVHSLPEPEEAAAVPVQEEKEMIKKNGGGDEAVSFWKLLSYADVMDWVLMVLGTLGSVVHGMAQPIGYLLLGKALDAFGNNIHDTEAMVRALKKVGQCITISLSLLHAYKLSTFSSFPTFHEARRLWLLQTDEQSPELTERFHIDFWNHKSFVHSFSCIRRWFHMCGIWPLRHFLLEFWVSSFSPFSFAFLLVSRMKITKRPRSQATA